ncbi:inositol-1-monophosphatase [Succinimonas amylolytica]|uniref:inositol-1-monophosphatase n=1 Tax=Succinimonas amylolytica TaxID=83769 RepID=UPI00036309C5|nr:inositol-1-monophosphatase [Succinimonas amylolytica]
MEATSKDTRGSFAAKKTPATPKGLLNIAVRAARAAGEIINRNFEDRDHITVQEKAKDDLVTNVDRECENAIKGVISRYYPEHGILAEESGSSKNTADSDYLWVIDPLDGTTNFCKGIPHIAVSIGVKIKGITSVGVVYDPIRNELFTATKGEGAILNNRKIRVSNIKGLDTGIFATAFPCRNREHLEHYQKILARVFSRCADIRRAGTASLDLAYVAAGRMDGYFELCLKPWDFCAGELLVREAGGVVTDFEGKPDYAKNGNIVAANPYAIQNLLREIKAAG